MAYLWVRPVASPPDAPHWAQDSGNMGWVHSQYMTPEQYAAERPCPFLSTCDPVNNYVWLDPTYPEYRNKVEYPLMGTWPPPQPGTDYDSWLAQQRQWMPYEAIASSEVPSEAACSEVLGVPSNKFMAQWLRFDWTASSDWPFITTWSGIRLVVQMDRHGYVTNEGGCPQRGPARVRVGIYKHTADYPALPTTWNAANFVSQEVEATAVGMGAYTNPYGTGIANLVFDFTTPPGGGSWLVAEQARYWVIVGQTLSALGKVSGSDNNILGMRKCWAAAIATLGGTPGQTSPDTIHTAVIG